ncbi:MAG: universal stress protein [Bacteroidota bacterium]|nr:universal stress protein [Bacteroidota bacterium]MDP4215629.1 universal stress protein [Bacteroidota bacterium]MDP4245596.1 universal stress protein [Bacteroidota bacterium]MDP4253680.1 universal stress protein [Bacteroidota bacterium]MDP4259576.1 universal stress protein [Bacteroidota bacterium]
MLRIIVPVDLTESSSNAARYAADMATALGGEIHLVHAMNLPPDPLQVPIPDYALDEMRDSSLTFLETLAADLKKRTNGKLSIGTDLETGDGESSIRAFCRWKQPFLVVADDAFQKWAPRWSWPFLRVPAQAAFHPVENIVVACDREDIHGVPGVAAGFLGQLRHLLGAHFDIVHFSLPGKAGRESPKPGSGTWIESESVEEGIRQYLASHHADWVTVFPKKGGSFHHYESLSENLLLECPLSAMAVHE